MRRTQIWLESEQHKALTEIAHHEKRSLSDVVREMLEKQIAERERRELANATQALLVDYQNDLELTVFQILDGLDY